MNCCYLISLLFLVIVEIESAVKCGQNIDTDSSFRIVGGEKAPKGKVPWQASILINGDNHCCGGSIIAPNLILTAAHCLWESKSYQSYVAVGALIRKNGYKVGQLVKVKELVFHPQWNAKTAFADIMLLVLNNSVKYTSSGNGKDTTAVGPICLPEPNWSHKGNGKAKISGFGRTTHGGTAADELLFIEEKVLSDSHCQRAYGKSNYPYNAKTMCCYGNMQGGKGTCQGDSGGPLVVRVGDKWVQKGIVSYGSICGGKNAPSVFTLVTAYLPWIKDEAKKRKIAL